MPTFHDITTDQLRQMIHLRERIDFLQEKLRKLRGDTPTKRRLGRPAGKYTLSADGRANMAAGQKARWAKINGKASLKKAAPAQATPKKKVMSPEAKAKIATAMKARWAAKKKESAQGK